MVGLHVGAGHDHPELLGALNRVAGVSQAGRANGTVRLLARDGYAAPLELITVQPPVLAVESVEYPQPNLEAVFLHLTGRALRD
jgi:ABC-2 type transport system ATP-binding protein